MAPGAVTAPPYGPSVSDDDLLQVRPGDASETFQPPHDGWPGFRVTREDRGWPLFRVAFEGIDEDELSRLRDPSMPVMTLGLPVDDPLHDRLFCAPCRAVKLHRLPVVLRQGVDVEPLDRVMSCGTFEKAWEYGGFPKVMLFFDRAELSGSGIRLDEGMSAAEEAELRARYPNELRYGDGPPWLTRLPVDHPMAGTAYESAYGCYVSGDPAAAVLAVALFGTEEMLGDLPALVQRAADDALALARANAAYAAANPRRRPRAG